nr:hypothetical protein [Tanacetum cinerariifolium]
MTLTLALKSTRAILKQTLLIKQGKVKLPGSFSLRVDTAYWCDLIRRIELVSDSTIVEIDLTWSLGLVSVELENRWKSGDLDSSRLGVLKCFLDDQNYRSGSLKDSQYVVLNGIEYAISIFLNEYAVLDRKLDTPYPIEVDTPYLFIDKNSVL